LKIRVHFLGILARHSGVDVLELDLPGQPCLQDLLEEIEDRFGPSFPFALWDREKKALPSSLFLRGQGRDLKAPEEPLFEHEEIYLLLPQAGG